MKSETDSQLGDLAGRIQSLDQFRGSLVRRVPDHDSVVVVAAPPAKVPVPRRARMFRRGDGVFGDLTVTAPRPRSATD